MIATLLVVPLSVVLIALVLQDAFEVMLLPRRVVRRMRLVRVVLGVTWNVWKAVATRIPQNNRRERFLSVYGPMSILLLIVGWAAGLILAFGLLQWALQSRASGPVSGVAEQLYMSGVTFFTLGYGDVVPHSLVGRMVAVVEAGAGLGFIAVVISYLPVLYQLFSRREALISQLDARAGSPPTALVMLQRHANSGRLDTLDDLLREWEVWASELMESHLSYPVLAFYRSQHDNQSWLAAIAAVMDTCALILVSGVEHPPLQARMTFTIARQVVVEISRFFKADPSPTPDRERLPHKAFTEMETILTESDIVWHGGPTAEKLLTALRETYEPLLEALSRRLLLPLPGWVTSEEVADYWTRGHQGDAVSFLINELSNRKVASTDEDSDRLARWERIERELDG